MRERATFRLAIVLLCCAAAARLYAQAGAAENSVSPELLDSVVAVVNGDVLLDSDLVEEERFAAFQPFTDASEGHPRQEAMARLVDRTLVEQQMKRQAAAPAVTKEQVDAELTLLRKSIPECEKYACTTDAGWDKFCEAHGFTPEQVEARWQERMALLKFIEQRFKTGIRISEPEIQDYYTHQFVPRFQERNMTAPPLSAISDRIQEILLQQRVNVLLEDWLKSLHDQGTVQILDKSLLPTENLPAVNLPIPATTKPGEDGLPPK